MAEKAYESGAFLNSREARPVRILAEYADPLSRFHRHEVIDTIVFMGSARLLPHETAKINLKQAKRQGRKVKAAKKAVEMSIYYEAARELAQRLTEWAKANTPRRYIVCTGGGPGIMEAANRGALDANGQSVGLTISLPHEFANQFVTPDLHMHFHYFFMRKFWLVYLAKAIVFMPGGFGTLDELFEILTLIQTGKIKKPLPIVLYGTKFWDKIINLPALVKYGTISAKDLRMIHRANTVDQAFDYITSELTRNRPAPGAVI